MLRTSSDNTSKKFLLEKYLILTSTTTKFSNTNKKGFSIMNALPSYTRAFPMLLGSSLSRMKLTLSFLPKYSSTNQATTNFDDSSDCSNNSQLKSNPYYEKYAEKIEKLKYTNPKEYTKRLAALYEKQSTTPEDKTKLLTETDQSRCNADETSSNAKGTKSLDSIMNLEKVKSLSTDDIRKLWIEHYSSKDAVCAVIPSTAYRTIHKKATQYPVFVYPVPRKDGYEMFVGQFSDDEFHFTSLINYQRHQENAISQLTLKHYTELEDEKGIVLMSGYVSGDTLSVTDAQLLSYLVQHFYMEHEILIQQFNQSPNTFKFEDVINAMDKTLLMKAGKSAV